LAGSGAFEGSRGGIVLRLFLPFVLLAGFVSAGPALAQSTPEECATIEADPDRLACYDAIFRNEVGQGEAVVIESERLIPALPTGREPATMTIACETAQVVTSFAFAGQFVSNTGDIAPVTLQVDQNATSVRTLTADGSNTSLRFAPGRESEAFLDSLAGGTNLRVRMTPVRQRSLTVDFRLPEHTDAIAALRSGC
jgi:hypothetical protein